MKYNKPFIKCFFILLIIKIVITQNLFGQCEFTILENSNIQVEKYTYLQHFRIKSARHSENATSAQFSISLTKGTTYLFSAENDPSQEGRAIVKLYDDFKYYTGNVTKDDRLLKGFSFACYKSGVYYLTIKFSNGGPGCAIVVMSMMNNVKEEEKSKKPLNPSLR